MAADNTLRLNRSLVPSLAVMDIPYVRMGETAVHVLIRQMEGGEVPPKAEKHWLKAELHAGESIANVGPFSVPVSILRYRLESAAI